ncbi:MAG: BamA/TamA family outer membrane protein [Cyclobacteriaceae bacterium]
MRILLVILCFPFFLFGQETEIFLVGDAGEPHFPNDATLDYLREASALAGPEDIMIFLGDNLYPKGLPPKGDPLRQEMEKKLNASLEVMKAFKGKVIMIPGNHDWQSAGKQGKEYLMEMQDYIDAYFHDETIFYPRNGCPGPVEVVVSDELVILIIDTQYLLHPYTIPDGANECATASLVEVVNQLRDLIRDHSEKHIVVAAHHPIYSYGSHGGRFPLRSHIFPLTDISKPKIWLPLPVIGSINPVYRMTFGIRQDISHPKYQVMRDEIRDALETTKNVVYVNGHEHSLQYIMDDSIHYITSGSGSKTSYVTRGRGSQFASSTTGFARLQYSRDGEVNLSFFDSQVRDMVFSKPIYTKKVITAEDLVDFKLGETSVTSPISNQYHGFGKAHHFWLGQNYRSAWATPVEMSVFDIGTEHGGLEIVKLGGGNQTKSLRLEAKDGRQFVLRSLEKYTEKLLPDLLQSTIAGDILQDQISAANPYGAFAIPALADAAGIYHTNPKLVYVPDDPRFGKYRETFAGLPVLYEERPNDEIAEQFFDGEGEDVKGTPDLIQELRDDNDEAVDQPFALRSRLFDMLIGDWDRHEDQWRWVRRDKEPQGHLWRPIPRDRDQAFFVNEGLVGWFASRRFILPNSEGFDEYMNYPPGFNTSARFFDRTFLNGLSWEAWQQEIEFLQSQLNEEIFREAMQAWPDTIRELSAEKTVKVLEARLADMQRYARIHYLFILKEVEVVGTDKHEYFLVERLNPDQMRVTVHKRKKDGELEQVIYRRKFLATETNEIRLYGLGGEDVFEFKGVNAGKIRVRVIGGDDDDLVDASSVDGSGKRVLVYDTKDTKLEGDRSVKSKLSDKPGVNFYNRTAFEYDKFIPLLNIQFNRDDGLFLGAGFIYTKEGWRKDPFEQKHQLTGNAALATGAVNLNYSGIFTDVVGSWDLVADLSLQQPYSVSNFFGFGNESDFDFDGEGIAAAFDDPIDFYRVRYNRSNTFLGLGKSLGVSGNFEFGVQHLSFGLDEAASNKFIGDPASGVDAATLDDSYHFLGFKAELNLDTRDNTFIPSKGVTSDLSFRRYYGMNDDSENFTRMSGSFGIYVPLYPPKKIVIASQVGVEHLIGDATFYNTASIGQQQVRGYRRNRFVGNTSFYNATDIRIHLINVKTYFLPMGIGIVGFHDVGRVWYNGESSDAWHRSQGFGVWLAPLNRVLATFHLAFSEEETLPLVTVGYQF